MNGHPPRPRRGVDPGNARDCIQPRDHVLRGGRRASPAESPAGRQARNESVEDELLRQLPAALGGYRAPVSADNSPQQQGRRGQALQQQPRRAVSVDGVAQQRTSLWAVDQAHGHGGGQQRPRQAPASSNPTAGNQPRQQGSKPKRVEQQPGQRRAVSVDGSAQHCRVPWAVDGNDQPHGHGGGQQRQYAQRPPPWGIESPSGQARQHVRETSEVRSLLPDIRNHGKAGRDSPHGVVSPGQGQRVQSEGPGVRAQGRSGPDARSGPLARSVSKATDANAQFRPYMEDRYMIVDPFMPGESNEQWAFYAVYDGHGGTTAAEHCNRELHKELAGQLRRAFKEQRNPTTLGDEAIADALTQTFQRVDAQLENMGAFNWGCTATVALVRRSGASLRLHVANVGDSRALAIDSSRGHTRVSQDHRPSDEAEARRVRQDGGFVQMGRVSGVLAVSRALGDFSLKGVGVSWRPSICVRETMSDTALVIASDGLWDYLGDGDVQALVQRGAREQSSDLAQRLIAEAKRRNSTDNLCCLVIFW